MNGLRDRLSALRAPSSRLGTWLAWIPAALWLIWALVRLAGLERGYPLVAMMSFSTFVVAATVLPIALALALRRRRAALACGLAGACLLALIVPRALPGDKGPDTGGIEIKIVSLNIRYGEADLGRLVELARSEDADVLLIQELTTEAERELRSLGLDREFPHRVVLRRDRKDGAAIYSRFRLREAGSLGEGFAMPVARFRTRGQMIEIANIHTFPPTIPDQSDDWGDALEAMPGAGEGPLRILAGDFNATLDHGAFRDLIGRGYRDAGDAFGAGLAATWSPDVLPLGLTIDHVLADERIGIAGYALHEIAGTDHRALEVDLVAGGS